MVEKYLVIGTYILILALLAVYGFHRSLLVYLFKKTKNHIDKPKDYFKELPFVTIQLPMYNEKYVAPRLLEATATIDYPKDKFEIQVLDDSTDETVELVKEKVEEIKKRGINISYIHRENRIGFKAGALEEGLKRAKGEFIAVFDADFIPPRDILMKTIHFFTDPKVGMVQTRWGHINGEYSLLTKIEALMLDGHFIIEHTARYRSGRFFNFNGTAGLWRRKAIEDSGGWHHDTLTEDMDLSYRAQLKGWKFIYLPDIVAPAEIPVEMNSFKSQQHRWAKGSIQVAKKLLPTILKSNLPLKIKSEAFFHLTNNIAYLLMVPLALLLLPNILVREPHNSYKYILLFDLPLFFGTTISIGMFYITTYRYVYPKSGFWEAFWRILLLMSLGIGLSINQAKAVLEGFFGDEGVFVRTPKHAIERKEESWKTKTYRAARNMVIPTLELLFALYITVTIIFAINRGHWMALPFLFLFWFGYLYVGIFSIYQPR